VRFPDRGPQQARFWLAGVGESWSSAPLAKNAVLGTAEEIFVLDNAFALIEGQPASRTGGMFA